MTCEYEHGTFGRCQQPPRDRLCHYHLRLVYNPRFRVDDYYHEKVVKGVVDLTDSYLTDVEVTTMFAGRRRSDGRRLDHYTT